MPAPPLSREQAQEAIDTVKKCGGNLSEAAARLGIPLTTLRGRYVRAASILDAPIQMGSERELYRLHKDNAELRREIKSFRESELDEEEVRKMLGRLADNPVHPPSWMISSPARKANQQVPEVPVLMLCDWHGGEVVRLDEMDGANEYNKRIMKERAYRVTNNAIKLTNEYGTLPHYPGMVLVLDGDFISGGLHGLDKTDDMTPIEAALYTRDILAACIPMLLEAHKKLYIPCSAGNHGRNTLRIEFTRYVYQNFDWLIYQMLARHFEGNRHIQFDIRTSNDVHFRIWRTRFLATHGDMLGVKGGDGIIGAIGPIMRGEIKTRASASSTISDFDHLLLGHWHQPLWLPRTFVSNTMKGWCPFAKNALRASPTPPSQHLFYVHPEFGVTSRWEVFANDRKHYKEGTPWVTMLEENA